MKSPGENGYVAPEIVDVFKHKEDLENEFVFDRNDEYLDDVFYAFR